MILPWAVAAAALAVALAAWALARRNARRVAQLSQMYWELKYQHGELRAQVQHLTGDTPAPAQPHHHPDPPVQADAFIPLASLKR
jgi:hypothetical protein